MLFVIVHGSYGSNEGNWFPELKERLEDLGQSVLLPQFPIEDLDEVVKTGPGFVPKKQTLDNWLAFFERLKRKFGNEPLCFVGHSLGPLFILHAVQKFDLQFDSAIFVSPFLDLKTGRFEFDEINKSFYKTDKFDWETLRRLIPTSYVLYSDNDPYVPTDKPLEFAKRLDSSVIAVKRAAHMNSEVNMNEFPLVYELCKTRIPLSLYQKYIEHRKSLFAVPYTKGRTEEVIYLKNWDEAMDEGVFHFRNLQKEGFGTFYTSLGVWSDPKSTYMTECRKAARRMKNFTRVIVADTPKDLTSSRIRKQIELDLEAGIRMHVCLWTDIKKSVPYADFGIWDNEYVNTVTERRGKTEVRMSSRKKDLMAAQKWKQETLKRAFPIVRIEDLKAFVERQKTRLPELHHAKGELE